MKNDIESIVLKVIERFHERFYPEAKARFIGASSDGKLAILFTGHICLTCGMSDYFVDFLEILNSCLNENYDIEDMMELNDEGTAWVVIYAPIRLIGELKRSKRIIVFDPYSKNKVMDYTLD